MLLLVVVVVLLLLRQQHPRSATAPRCCCCCCCSDPTHGTCPWWHYHCLHHIKLTLRRWRRVVTVQRASA